MNGPYCHGAERLSACGLPNGYRRLPPVIMSQPLQIPVQVSANSLAAKLDDPMTSVYEKTVLTIPSHGCLQPAAVAV